MHRPSELRGAGRRLRHDQRQLLRCRRQHERRFRELQVRRDGSVREWEREPRAGQQRLVQPRAHVAFSGSDGLSGPVACTGGRNYTGPDSASVTINGSCSDQAGNTSGASVSFKYDATDPSASGSASRGPDSNGWYNHGLTVAFSGSDGLSGPVACTGGRNYTGPDSASVTINGSCSDQAGNSSGASVSFKYDATDPSASGSASRGPDSNGWYNHGLTIAFSGSDGLSGPVACTGGRNYAGPDSASVTINGSCSDQAGNTSGASVSFKYDATDPSASGSASRGPDSNGWYNHGLTRRLRRQ